MRVWLVLSAWLLGVALAPAAPRPGGLPSPRRSPPRTEARLFAQQLLGALCQVENAYFKEVKRVHLAHVALCGLYEGARRPIPRGLRARVERAVAGAGPAVGPDGIPLPPPPGGDPLARLFRQVREEVGDAEGLRGQVPLVVCCQAMTRLLDPHSTVVSADEQQHSLGLEAECHGVGLELDEHGGQGPLTVTGVLLGGPAQRAGLRPGDEVTHLDGKPARSAPPPGLLALRTRASASDIPVVLPGANLAALEDVRSLRVTFRRPGEAEPRTADLPRERFHPETVLGVSRRADNSWSYLVDAKRGIAHVRLACLGRGTAEELRVVLGNLQAGRLGGLILDLRWCPGGYLNEAVEVADLFVGRGVIATVRSREGEPMVYAGTQAGTLRGFPMVVLVNGDTSGGAELIAAALQDHKRALVVGQRTRGKASVQSPVALGVPGYMLKLTSGTFVRPCGKNLHRLPDSKPEDDWGVRPDAGGEFRVSADLARRLARWWLEQSLRPGPSRERLELDDPAADPQRQAALELLRKRLAEKGPAGES
jgi:carboxyl-terminal processing protease